jgi:hypothetical membrane protein
MSTQTIRPHRPSIRWLALAGIIGPALFIMTVIAIGARQDGYSHVWQAISELGGVEAQYPVLQNVNFLMMGFSMLAFFGLAGGIAQGLLPCDIACRGETPVGLLHNVTGVAGFVAAITGMLVFARRWQLDETWRLHARFTRLAAVLAVTAFISFILVSALMPSGPRGLVQRIFVGTLLVWLMVTSWRLWNRPSAVPRERVSA